MDASLFVSNFLKIEKGLIEILPLEVDTFFSRVHANLYVTMSVGMYLAESLFQAARYRSRSFPLICVQPFFFLFPQNICHSN